MGRMQDALKKAAEERERRRMMESKTTGVPAPEAPLSDPAPEVVVPRTQRVRAPEHPREQPREQRRRTGELARIPAAPVKPGPDERLVVFYTPSDPRAEDLRKVRANLLALDPRPKTIMIASGARNEGKSLLAANLALTLLEMGEREVLLVDANLRHPQLAKLVGGRSEPGLSDVITAEGGGLETAITDTAVPRLKLLPAGSGGVDAARQLQPDVLKDILERVRDRFAFVVIDTPSSTDYADAVLMSNDVDGVLVVVNVGGGRRKATQTVLGALEGARARVLGTVIVTGT
jgi:capsular exopolysaccharide synthesis family protein